MPAKTSTMDLVPVETALVSVYDKANLLAFVEGIHAANPRLQVISSGGTYKHLQPQSRDLGYELTEVSDYTGFPESPEGLVKTLHPKIHGGLLLDFVDPTHAKYAMENDIVPIDMAVVNLYPFRGTVESGADIEAIRHMIDIGGPTMVRAAAKNFRRVAIVTNPGAYGRLLEEIRENRGATRLATRFDLATDAFQEIQIYDEAIDAYLRSLLPDAITKFYLQS